MFEDVDLPLPDHVDRSDGTYRTKVAVESRQTTSSRCFSIGKAQRIAPFNRTNVPLGRNRTAIRASVPPLEDSCQAGWASLARDAMFRLVATTDIRARFVVVAVGAVGMRDADDIATSLIRIGARHRGHVLWRVSEYGLERSCRP